jgi:DNA-directed RNA polymerase subunit M/transcription elongation factor TFIIS
MKKYKDKKKYNKNMSFEDFEFNCEVSLNQFIKKDYNRKTIAKMLWRRANGDMEYANYLCFEIMADYYCSFKLKDIINNIKRKKIGWNHINFEYLEKKQREYDEFILHPPEVEEGVIECHKCGSKKTYSFSKQTRRADESATVFVRCSNCSNTFKM